MLFDFWEQSLILQPPILQNQNMFLYKRRGYFPVGSLGEAPWEGDGLMLDALKQDPMARTCVSPYN